MLALLAALALASAGPVNDNYAQRIAMQLGSVDSRSNAEATIEPEERLTANDPGELRCDKQGQAAAEGVQVKASLWWSFTGDGGPITVSTASSGFDTVLAVYEVPTKAMLACNDDIQPLDPSREALGARVTSELVLNTIAGREYAVQAGGCSGVCAMVTSGTIALRVSPAPVNDDRGSATPILAGEPLSATNFGATLEPDENALCGENPYAKTVWFRWLAPAPGTAIFSSSGFDTVLAVYQGASATPLGCNDDAVEDELAGSQLPMREPPGPPFEVSTGEYLIQVGGAYNTGFSTIAARNGPLSVQVQFSEDTDLDNDGVQRDQDCNDNDPAVHPGALEIPNNEVDENCDGTLAYDRDGDSYLAPPSGGDCNDTDPATHPGATEILSDGIDQNCDRTVAEDRDGDGHLVPPNGDDCNDAAAAVYPGAPEVRGNQVDENCDGKAPPLPVLKTVIDMHSTWFDPPKSYNAVAELFVGRAMKGSIVRVRCHGRCPFQSKGPIKVRQPRGKLVLAHGFTLGPGAELEIRVTKAGWIGRQMDYLIRASKPRLEFPHCIGPDEALRPCARP